MFALPHISYVLNSLLHINKVRQTSTSFRVSEYSLPKSVFRWVARLM